MLLREEVLREWRKVKKSYFELFSKEVNLTLFRLQIIKKVLGMVEYSSVSNEQVYQVLDNIMRGGGDPTIEEAD